MNIFSQKWRYFTIGCISVLILFFLKWWVAIIGTVFLVCTHPKVAIEMKKLDDRQDTQKKSFFILIFLLVICYLSVNVSGASKQRQVEKQKIIEATAEKEEQYRLQNALAWDIGTDPSLSEKEKIFIKSAADNLIANEKTCNEIIMGGESTTAKNSYYLQCKTKSKGYFKIYFTENDLKEGRVLKIIEPYPEKLAMDICFQRQWNAIKFPKTMKTISWEKDVTYANGDRKIEQAFSAENTYGMPVRNRLICIVNSIGDVVEFKVAVE